LADRCVRTFIAFLLVLAVMGAISGPVHGEVKSITLKIEGMI